MAARLNTRQHDSCIDKIKTTLLIKAVQNHALEGTEYSSTQLKAAEMLLNRTLPVLQRQEILADVEGLTINLVSQLGNDKHSDN